MDTLVTLSAIAAIGVAYVLLPVGLSVFAEFRKPNEIICPENCQPAQVAVDATLRRDDVGCWDEQTPPGRMLPMAGRGACDRACLSQLAH